MTDKDRQVIENRKQVHLAFGMTEDEYAMKEAREMLLECFPGSFVNSRDEFIAHPRTNQYFILQDCKTLRISRPRCWSGFREHLQVSALLKSGATAGFTLI